MEKPKSKAGRPRKEEGKKIKPFKLYLTDDEINNAGGPDIARETGENAIRKGGNHKPKNQ